MTHETGGFTHPVIDTLRENDIDPHAVIIPPAYLERGCERAETHNPFHIQVIGETALAGVAGESELRPAQVPVFNGLLLADAPNGRTALLDAVDYPTDTPASFARSIKAILSRLHAVTGVPEEIPLVRVTGYGRGTDYELHPGLTLSEADEGTLLARLFGSVTVREARFNGSFRHVAGFPNKKTREKIFTLMLREYGDRPLSAAAYATLLDGKFAGKGAAVRGITQLRYPVLDNALEARLFGSIEDALLAFSRPDYIGAGNKEDVMAAGVTAYNQLVFHSHYIASAVARKYSHRLPFDDIYQEAMMIASRVVKRHEFWQEDGTLKGNVVTSVDRGVRRLVQEQEPRALRIPHNAIEALHGLQDITGVLAERLKRQPLLSEIAAEAGTSPDRVLQIRQLQSLIDAVPLEATVHELDARITSDLVADANGMLFDQWLAQRHARQMLDVLMDSSLLSAAEKAALSVQYGVYFSALANLEVRHEGVAYAYPAKEEDLPLPGKGMWSNQAVGGIMGLSAAQVGALQESAIYKARQFLRVRFGMVGSGDC